MKFSALIASAIALTGSLVAAQIDGIPACATTCAITALTSATGCSLSDIACICKAQGFITSISPCVKAACSPADYQTTLVAAAKLCATAGVTLDVSSIAAAASTATSQSAGTSVAATTTSSGSGLSSGAASKTSSIASVISSASSAASSTAASATPKSGAGHMEAGSIGMGAVAAVLALVL